MPKSASESMIGATGEDEVRFQQTMRAVETGPRDAPPIGRR